MSETNQIEKAVAAVEFLWGCVVDAEKQARSALIEALDAIKRVEGSMPDDESRDEEGVPDAIWNRVVELGSLSNRISLAYELIVICKDNVERYLLRLRAMREHSEMATRLVRMAFDDTRRVYELGDDVQAIATQILDVAAAAREKLVEVHRRTASTN
jgi:hypothetical protein